MNRPKIVDYLRLLSSRELGRFKKFTQSPYHNSDERLVALLDAIAPFSKVLPDKKLEREALFNQVFPGEPYDYSKISNLLSYLNNLLKEFWVVEELKTNKQSSERNLLAVSTRLSNETLFKDVDRNVQKRLEKNKSSTDLDYYHQFKVEDFRDKFTIGTGQRINSEHLPLKMAALDLFFVGTMLKNLCSIINRSNILKIQADLDQYSHFLSYIEQNSSDYTSQPFISIYYQIYLTLTDGEEERHFHALTALLRNNGSLLPRAEVQEMFRYAQNYCIKQINQGNSPYLRSLFELYQQNLVQGILVEGKNMYIGDFKNIVSLGIRLQEYDWTEQFVEDYHSLLPNEMRENALRYNRAALFYARKDYSQAMQILTTSSFQDVFYQLGMRSLILKIHYERQDWELLEPHLHAFEMFMRRNQKISEFQVEVHQNMVRYVRRMMRLRSRRTADAEEVKELQGQVEAESAVANKGWLIGMIKKML